MEYVQGKPMGEAWRELDEEQKSKLVKKVADLVITMAEVSTPLFFRPILPTLRKERSGR